MSDGVKVASPADLAAIAAFNRTETAFRDDVTLQQLIEEGVARHPDRIAVICAHDKAVGMPSLTYAQINERANQVAHRLQGEGVGRGDIVALMVERSYAMIVGIFAIVKAGAAYLPISPDSPPERVQYALENAGVKALLGQAKTVRPPSFAGLMLNLEDPLAYSGPTANPVDRNEPRDLAYVIYTSGSTGRPKGVMIEHRSLVNRLAWMQRAYPIGDGDVILQKTPYHFDVSVWELFWWAFEGAALCFLMPGGERNPLALVDAIKRNKVSVLHFVPSMLNVFLEYIDGKAAAVSRDLASVRHVFASGEALAPSHVKRFNRVWGELTGSRLINLYGPTEATVDVSYFDCPSGESFETIPIGKPIDNTRFHVLRDGRQVALGEPGELCIAGVGLARGYLNNEALTAERFTDNPANPGERIYRTGDIARWLPDGNVEYLGREDHQVKIRGLRIELGEIENNIREFDGVADCVAVVKKYSDNVILIVAYLVARADLDLNALKQFLARKLPDYMIPSHFERIDAIPLTSTGKADRKALPEPDLRVKAG